MNSLAKVIPCSKAFDLSGKPLSAVILAISWLCNAMLASEPLEVFPVWKDGPPSAVRVPGPEQILENRPRPFYQLTNISSPTVSVFLPAPEKRLGAAILVCPGGGLQRLAFEHEGLEVAQWLNSQGIAAFVLKYRVPAPVHIGLQDAQRAMCLIRSRAAEWNIDPDCLGAIGFSAGAEICAWLATHDLDRQYPKQDHHDDVSPRPTFIGLIYAGGLVGMRGGVNERITSKLTTRTPPMFITHALPDASQNSLELAVALKRAGVPCELHVYQEGAHGFGVRTTGQPLDAWRNAFLRWAAANGYLDNWTIRKIEKEISLPSQSANAVWNPNRKEALSFDDAYAIQRRIVRRHLESEKIIGYRWLPASDDKANAQQKNVSAFATFFESQKASSANMAADFSSKLTSATLELGLGFVMGTDIAVHVPTSKQARESVEKIGTVMAWTPISHLDYGRVPAHSVATNWMASRMLIGPTRSAKELDPTAVSPKLLRSGEGATSTATSSPQDTWEQLHKLINEIVDRGYTIPAGGVLFLPMSIVKWTGDKGNYVADFGSAGAIELTVP